MRPPTWAMSRLLWILLALGAARAAVSQPLPEIHYSFRLFLPVQGDFFRKPLAVTADWEVGEIFVSDSLTNRILIFDRDGLFRFELSGGYFFRSPLDLAVDKEGYMFLLAYFRGRRAVSLLDFDGKFIEEIQLSGTTEAEREPRLKSLALSPDGNRLYFLDDANQRMWITDRKGTVLSSQDLANDLTEQEALEQVLGRVDVYHDTVLVAVPTAGQVYLYDLDGTWRTGVGIKGTAPCQTPFPIAAALDLSGNVIVADLKMSQLMIWDPATNNCLGAHGALGNAPGAFIRPVDLTLDRSGRIFVTQQFEGRVQAFDLVEPTPPGNADGAP